jgi:RimJ/RimL family protein N-acetyltransferase
MEFNPTPVALHGQNVSIEPLTKSDREALYEIGREADDWRYMPRTCFRSREDVSDWIDQALELQATGEQVCFVLRTPDGNRLMGSTRFMVIRKPHRGLEIGWTWLGREFQRTVVNTETKFLLLRHCFEELGAMRVEFKTDSRNLRSQNAIERIGAVREGVFRHHMIAQNNYVRDSVYFSIVDTEWPNVKLHLESLLVK